VRSGSAARARVVTAPADPRVKLTLRLAPALHQRLAAIAAASNRSLNAQITDALEREANQKEPTR
jgi:predicted HicB family RNase H-like nuclease